jgi:hypothetical protein
VKLVMRLSIFKTIKKNSTSGGTFKTRNCLCSGDRPPCPVVLDTGQINLRCGNIFKFVHSKVLKDVRYKGRLTTLHQHHIEAFVADSVCAHQSSHVLCCSGDKHEQ